MQVSQRGVKWVRCPKCGHKLFRVMTPSTIIHEYRMGVRGEHLIEIKCHSCKEISEISVW